MGGRSPEPDPGGDPRVVDAVFPGGSAVESGQLHGWEVIGESKALNGSPPLVRAEVCP